MKYGGKNERKVKGRQIQPFRLSSSRKMQKNPSCPMQILRLGAEDGKAMADNGMGKNPSGGVEAMATTEGGRWKWKAEGGRRKAKGERRKAEASGSMKMADPGKMAVVVGYGRAGPQGQGDPLLPQKPFPPTFCVKWATSPLFSCVCCPSMAKFLPSL